MSKAEQRGASGCRPRTVGAPCDALLHGLVGGAVVDKPNIDRATDDRARHALAEMQRHAAAKRGVDRIAINIARLRRRSVTRISNKWRRHDVAIALERKAHRILHAVFCLKKKKNIG